MGLGTVAVFWARQRKAYPSTLIMFGVCQCNTVETSSRCRELIRIWHSHMMMTHRNTCETPRKRKRRARPNHQLLLSHPISLMTLSKDTQIRKKTLLIKTFLYKSESNCAGWLNSFSEVRKAIDVPKLLARVKKLHRLGWDVRLSKHGPIKKVNSLKLAGLVDGPARWLIYLIFISPHLPIVFFFLFASNSVSLLLSEMDKKCCSFQ